MLFSKKTVLASVAVFFVCCAGLNGPATVSDIEVQAEPEIVPAEGYTSSAVYVRTKTHIYEAARIEQMIRDTILLTPFPFWNVEPRQVYIDDIISITIPKKDNSANGFVLGFSFGFSFMGIIGLSSSEYNDDYQTYLMLSALSGLLWGGFGCCLCGGINDVSTRNHYDFRKMPPDEKRRVLYKIMKDRQ